MAVTAASSRAVAQLPGHRVRLEPVLHRGVHRPWGLARRVRVMGRPLPAPRTVFAAAPAEHETSDEVVCDLRQARCLWVSANVLLAPVGNAEVTLCSSATAALSADAGQGVVGHDSRRWRLERCSTPTDVMARLPYLAQLGLSAFHLATDDATILALLKTQLAVEARRGDGAVTLATGVQLAGALDALCTYDGPLGIETQRNGGATLRVWAPTAQARPGAAGAVGSGAPVPFLTSVDGVRGNRGVNCSCITRRVTAATRRRCMP